MRKLITYLIGIVSTLALLFAFFKTNVSENGKNNTVKGAQTTEYVTARQMAEFLSKKNEHYPLSDEFIERYQQDDGGYIDNAKKAGIVVDKTLHSPNQKWHFFESWFYPSIEDGTLTYEDKASSVIYSRLKCPELLLWIMEACGVAPNKVRDAKIQAETDKVLNTNVSTAAASLRKIVPWALLEEGILNGEGGELTPPTQAETYAVNVNAGEGYTISGLKSAYEQGSSVQFTVSVTDPSKQIKNVSVEGVTVTKVSTYKYSFAMPAQEVTIYVELEEKEVSTPEAGSVALYDIVYDLGSKTTSVSITDANVLLETFSLNSGTNIINQVSGLTKMYGGGYGGSGDTKWYMGNMLKFGTQSAVGDLSLSLNTNVNRVVITGYVNFATCKLQAGDANSTDWLGSSGDGKTTTVTCSDMSIVSKEVVENHQTSQIVIDFASTSEFKLAVLSKGPLYITSIEFLYVE